MREACQAFPGGHGVGSQVAARARRSKLPRSKATGFGDFVWQLTGLARTTMPPAGWATATSHLARAPRCRRVSKAKSLFLSTQQMWRRRVQERRPQPLLAESTTPHRLSPQPKAVPVVALGAQKTASLLFKLVEQTY